MVKCILLNVHVIFFGISTNCDMLLIRSICDELISVDALGSGLNVICVTVKFKKLEKGRPN